MIDISSCARAMRLPSADEAQLMLCRISPSMAARRIRYAMPRKKPHATPINATFSCTLFHYFFAIEAPRLAAMSDDTISRLPVVKRRGRQRARRMADATLLPVRPAARAKNFTTTTTLAALISLYTLTLLRDDGDAPAFLATASRPSRLALRDDDDEKKARQVERAHGAVMPRRSELCAAYHLPPNINTTLPRLRWAGFDDVDAAARRLSVDGNTTELQARVNDAVA